MSIWTEQHQRILEDGHATGKSARDIAAEISAAGYPATRNTVLGRVHRLGWSRPMPKRPPRARLAIVEHKGCRWPIGNPGEPGFRFCHAMPVVLARPYCEKHCAVAYRKPDAEPKKALSPPKAQRPGTIALVPTVPPMRGMPQ